MIIFIRFKIILNDLFNPEQQINKNYYFVFNNIDGLTGRFQVI